MVSFRVNMRSFEVKFDEDKLFILVIAQFVKKTNNKNFSKSEKQVQFTPGNNGFDIFPAFSLVSVHFSSVIDKYSGNYYENPDPESFSRSQNRSDLEPKVTKHNFFHIIMPLKRFSMSV